MLPRKSLSQMIGSGVAVAPGGNSPTCGHCRLRETCHYRMTA